MTKTFEKLNQYKAQNQTAAETSAFYAEKVKAAEQAVEAEKIKIDELVHLELASKVDKSVEKKAARKKIAEAEKEVEYAKDEQKSAASFANAKTEAIRAIDVVNAYQSEYAPAVKAEHLPELQERYKQGEALILSAIKEYNELRAEYDDVVAEVKPLSDLARKMRQTSDMKAISNPFIGVHAIGFDSSELAHKLSEVNK